jgi:hypothetical protein
LPEAFRGSGSADDAIFRKVSLGEGEVLDIVVDPDDALDVMPTIQDSGGQVVFGTAEHSPADRRRGVPPGRQRQKEWR